MDVAAAALWGSQTCFILVAIWAADYSFDFEWTWSVRWTGALRIFLRGCCRHDVRVWGIWLDSSCSKEAVCGPFGVKMVFPPRRVRDVWFVGQILQQLSVQHVKLSLDGKTLHSVGGSWTCTSLPLIWSKSLSALGHRPGAEKGKDEIWNFKAI